MEKKIECNDGLEKERDAIVALKIKANEIMELVDICILASEELKDKVRGGINAVLAGSDRNEVVNEVVEYVLENYTNNKMVNYLENSELLRK